MPSVNLQPSHLMATVPVCLSTALVVDCGYSETSVIAVYSSYPVFKSYMSAATGSEAIHRFAHALFTH